MLLLLFRLGVESLINVNLYPKLVYSPFFSPSVLRQTPPLCSVVGLCCTYSCDAIGGNVFAVIDQPIELRRRDLTECDWRKDTLLLLAISPS